MQQFLKLRAAAVVRHLTLPTALWIAATMLGASDHASAQTATSRSARSAHTRVDLLLPLGAPTERSTRWQERLEGHAGPQRDEAIVDVHTLRAQLGADPHTIARADIAALSAVQHHLRSARIHAAQLDEAAALIELASAEQRVVTLQHVPGASLFYAEVQTAIGLVAAQAGSTALASAALRKAAVIDPARGVRAAEATPTWVQRAAAIADEVATAPIGEVPIVVDAPNARVYLDDTLQGVAPLTVRARRGVHWLRVESNGYRTLGLWLPIDVGTRPQLNLELASDPLDAALTELADRARANDVSGLRATLERDVLRDAPLSSVWLLRVGALRDDRALLTRCDADDHASQQRVLRCDEALRLELDPHDRQGWGFGLTLDPAGLGRDRRARDEQWVDAGAPEQQPRNAQAVTSPWWGRWYVWAAVTAVTGGTIAAAFLAQPATEAPQLRVRVEP